MKQLVGKEILNDPFMNKGTAFTYEERKKFGLTGLLPTVVRTLEEQVRIEYEKVSQYDLPRGLKTTRDIKVLGYKSVGAGPDFQ